MKELSSRRSLISFASVSGLVAVLLVLIVFARPAGPVSQGNSSPRDTTSMPMQVPAQAESQSNIGGVIQVVPVATEAQPLAPTPVPTLPPPVADTLPEPPSLATPRPTEPVLLVRQRVFTSWSYKAIKEEDGIPSAEIRFDDSSVRGILAFAAENRELATQLALSGGQVDIEVTFHRLLSTDAYRAWAATAGISYFQSAHLLARDRNDGPPPQIGVISKSNDPLPLENFSQALEATDRGYGPADVRGVDSFKGRVDASRLPSLIADPQVFLVDVTKNIVRSDLRDARVAMWERARIHQPVLVYVAMERLGLANFP